MLDELNRGPKVDVHLSLYEKDLAILDAQAKRYNCSRAAVVAAWAREFAALDLAGKVSPSSMGRPPKKR